MSKALSLDLRVRVLTALAQGASHRQAGERFRVSASSVSRWRTRERAQGDARPKPLGGDRKSGRIEAQAETILALLEAKPEASVAELRRCLSEKGLSFGESTIRRFFKRHQITRKKRRRTRASRSAPTS